MTITELRKKMMLSKKTDPERSKVLAAILNEALLISKGDGNREATEKDIVVAAKRELKLTQQSKDSGAPYNPLSFEVCESFLPKTMNEEETVAAINIIVAALPDKSIKMIGQVMGQLKSTYKDSVDGSLASKLAKEILSK